MFDELADTNGVNTYAPPLGPVPLGLVMLKTLTACTPAAAVQAVKVFSITSPKGTGPKGGAYVFTPLVSASSSNIQGHAHPVVLASSSKPGGGGSSQTQHSANPRFIFWAVASSLAMYAASSALESYSQQRKSLVNSLAPRTVRPLKNRGF